ncbi:hypothetical protein [Stenotrophomonas sp. CC120223-11]|uniref:hypothetical protein n=1 Tax=Stenotrophomonas sp. CC120223-11 TaxID=1378090 RepID=UPI000BDBA07B|nr:hypothetical protein [Stenotrophomonas sp. CC120223-11]SNY63296.1 hypothetical protein SAMN02744784_01161 [Stenotrophomonas sp. CC120223-11]
MNKQQSYPNGIDCTWLGVDKFGAVAAFVTAGQGEIPSAILEGDSVDLREIEFLLMALPMIADINLRVRVPRPDDFMDMACRGLYVYDWNGARYTLVAEPRSAMQCSALSDELKSIAEFAVFDSIEFSKQESISVGSIMEVVQPAM